MPSHYCISLASVQKAQTAISGLVHRTPVLTNSTLDQWAERKIFLKCELFQKTGSFKIRGALNAVSNLGERGQEGLKARAVVTHSSGNHGQALALAARLQGIASYVVVPQTAPACKKAAMLEYGARLVECEPTDQSRVETASRTVTETQGILVHPNQDPLVIAGQGTIGLEILQQVPDVQAVVVPVGGGGLISGIAVAIKTQHPQVKIYAAEPEAADDCYQSKRSGWSPPTRHPPVTMADAVKTSIGSTTWPIIRDLVDDVFTVSEEEIQRATRLVWERAKLVIEPTAGLGVAVVLSRRFRDLPSSLHNVCVVLCGGNVDLDSPQWLRAPSVAS
ncbi:LOW QUALITY PROTEIN: serine racemase [Pristis pectinata]|uniref:LOW QUALITY PROTEIN: serine racemase n=1 Tax=Pristis pectinata TaxID=685728 RepID=UPI00223E7A30|nr:LOW QUALITY PROTEIN: serine racemase [Pristis pectinata]